MRTAMEKEGCRIQTDETRKWGHEIICSVGNEKVTGQVSQSLFSGVSLSGERIQKVLVDVWIGPGNMPICTTIDQDIKSDYKKMFP
jgi:hypothetical protein